MPTLNASQITDISCRLLEGAGVSRAEALIVATELCDANLVGHDSHGIMRVMQYVQMIEEGFVKPGGPFEVVKETLAGSWKGLLWSIEKLFVGIALAGPWILLLGLLWILWPEAWEFAIDDPAGLVGTPVVAGELDDYRAFAFAFVGVLLLTQWLFLRPRRGWTVRLAGSGRLDCQRVQPGLQFGRQEIVDRTVTRDAAHTGEGGGDDTDPKMGFPGAVERRVMAAFHMVMTSMKVAFVDHDQPLRGEAAGQFVFDRRLYGHSLTVSPNEGLPVTITCRADCSDAIQRLGPSRAQCQFLYRAANVP